MSNAIKTGALLVGLTVLLVLIGDLLGGQQGMMIAFVIALGMNFFSYWFSDKIVLKLYRAREISQTEAPWLYDMVGRLVGSADLPMPKLYLIPSANPNAFATGRNPRHAAIAVTEGILRVLDREELEGVLAHELAHVRNRDILIGTVAATIAGAVMLLARMAQFAALFGGFGGRDNDRGGGILGLLVTAFVAPIAALVIQMAISRSREYQADATGASIAHNAEGLARALERLQAAGRRAPFREAQPATAHMFIVSPFSGGSLFKLFSTHPPLEERVRRLRSMTALR